MIYRQFQDLNLSLLGFGTMRLPKNEDGSIDRPQVNEMVKYAIDHGVNYFDTAWPYHDGDSEVAIGEALKQYPRESFYLADKFPAHQNTGRNIPAAELFEEQLKKCQVEYFDFYLLHNVMENTVSAYEDEKLGIIPYLLEQKKNGRIKHLGFSSHGRVEMLREFLDKYGDIMEFCQIQFNYFDYSLQNAKEKYELLTERNIPVWVMEPLRGGALKNQSEAFRWIERFDNIHMILSGMSEMDHMRENVAIFHAEDPLSDLDTNGLKLITDKMVDMVPCTGCHYCDGCPMGLDIPLLMQTCSEARYSSDLSITMCLESLDEDKRPASCIQCGACLEKCPQKIEIPEIMKELDERWSKMKRWVDICRERDEKEKKNR
ncbi:MAG: aldo/keto reductase [Clostridia bacterium]|nr:aldo/keto reductase [Clostridia bacterium]